MLWMGTGPLCDCKLRPTCTDPHQVPPAPFSEMLVRQLHTQIPWSHSELCPLPIWNVISIFTLIQTSVNLTLLPPNSLSFFSLSPSSTCQHCGYSTFTTDKSRNVGWKLQFLSILSRLSMLCGSLQTWVRYRSVLSSIFNQFFVFAFQIFLLH